VTGPPFGASVPAVRSMVLSISEGQRPVGATQVDRVPDDQVRAWIDEGAAEVAVAIHGYERLAGAADQGGQDQLVDVIETRARGLVQTYAAGMLSDATYPERAGRAAASYGTTLMTRYVDGLERLAGYVGAELDRLDLLEPDTSTAAADARTGPVASFPASFLRDGCGRPIGF
jgi:hypothetical protein